MRRNDLENLVLNGHIKVKKVRRITYLTSMICSGPHTHIPESFLLFQIVYIQLNLIQEFAQKVFAFVKVKFGQSGS